MEVGELEQHNNSSSRCRSHLANRQVKGTDAHPCQLYAEWACKDTAITIVAPSHHPIFTPPCVAAAAAPVSGWFRQHVS